MTPRSAAFAALAASLALATGSVRAQGEGVDVHDEIQRTQRQLQQKRAEVDRLVEQRLRHDLGLPLGDADPTPVADVATDAATMERMRRDLRTADAETSSLLERFARLQAAVEQLKAETDERTRRELQERTFVAVPQPGDTPPEGLRARMPSNAAREVAPPAVPAGETRSATLPDVVQLDPLRAQIHGSSDHQRIAHALFKAGQALFDRGAELRERGDVELARQFDERGKERLDRALAELEPLLSAKQPPFAALFCQGRCRELLFRYSERHEGLSLTKSPRDYQRREQEVREPFLSISARDVVKTGARGEVDLLGPWGQAAQTAIEHFRWMNVHAGYEARTTIEQLTWPGERSR